MVTRDRSAAGRKASETNQKKDSRYYNNIGSLGGIAVSAVKRAFASIPGLASKAAKAKYLEPDQGVVYRVKSEQPTRTLRTREEARQVKRELKASGYKAQILRTVYQEGRPGYILEQKEVW